MFHQQKNIYINQKYYKIIEKKLIDVFGVIFSANKSIGSFDIFFRKYFTTSAQALHLCKTF